jgi:3-oxoacyl-[acyl-carrier-protein] synthase-3
MNEVFITQTASFLPNEPVGNDEMESTLGMPNGQPSRVRRLILRNNGIRQRHYVIDRESGRVTHNNARLTAEAVEGLFASGVARTRVDLLACGTTLADQLVPNHAVMVHGALGLPPLEAIATSGVCLSGMLAFKYAFLAVRASSARMAICTGSEISSLAMRAQQFAAETAQTERSIKQRPELAFEKDFLRWMLSDGAGAWALEPEAGRAGGRPMLRVEWVETFSYAHAAAACMTAGASVNDDGSLSGWMEQDPATWHARDIFAVKQDVRLLDRLIARYTVAEPLRIVRERRELHADAIDWFVPHLSSTFFTERLAQTLDEVGLSIPRERWFTNLATRGNTGSASAYILVDDLIRSGRLRAGERILLFVPESARFGSGFVYLSVV